MPATFLNGQVRWFLVSFVESSDNRECLRFLCKKYCRSFWEVIWKCRHYGVNFLATFGKLKVGTYTILSKHLPKTHTFLFLALCKFLFWINPFGLGPRDFFKRHRGNEIRADEKISAFRLWCVRIEEQYAGMCFWRLTTCSLFSIVSGLFGVYFGHFSNRVHWAIFTDSKVRLNF